ncbi:formyltransferase family protein [Hyphomonas sp.]|uniref:methionyl-tRNA formyltransferase n=1 Tax=Hyphomonas sp. TaxID=87 RepID=UPI0030F9B36F
MFDLEKQPFTCAGVGLKANEYLRDLNALGVRPTRMVSYRQATDQLSSFDSLAAFCAEISIPLEETRRPSFAPDELVFMVGWQYLVRDASQNVIVFHDSLLPKYRGFAPTVTAMINGESRIGVTALKPVNEVDAGPIIGQIETELHYPMLIAEALRKQAQSMSKLTIEILGAIVNGMPAGAPQNEAEATYSLWRDGGDYWIDWSQSAARIARIVDAVGPPYEGARSLYNGEEIIIRAAQALPDLVFEIRQPGKVWKLEDGAPVVVCEQGLLKIIHAETPAGQNVAFDRLRSRFAGKSPEY